MTVRGLGLLMTALMAGPLSAQGTPVLDTVFARLRAGPPSPALAMAVLHRGRIVYQNAAGYADLEREVPASLETRFDVASIAKQFTAFALAQLVEQGRASPDDPVTRHLPELDLAGARITVGQLIHHTSGLEDADGLMALAGWQPGDEVSHEQLVGLLLRQQHLRFAPGEQHFYSNGGYTLLAEVVARLVGRPFPEHLDSAVFRPLGMRQTMVPGDGRTLVPHRALPYVRSGGAFRPSRVDSYLGAGGLYSTVGDLTRWALHLMHAGRDSAATMQLRERGRLNSGDLLEYAWGLVRGSYRGHETLAHSGSGPATEAQLLLIPALEFAVIAVAAGPTGVNPTWLAFRSADTFLAGELGPVAEEGSRRMLMMTEEDMNRAPAESGGMTVPAARLRQLAGTYQLGDNPPMVIRAGAGRLEFAWGGRAPYIPLHPLPDGRFVMMPLWDVYRFTTDAEGRGIGIVRERTPQSLRRGGPDRVEGTRLPDRAALDSAAAAAYLGWYHGDEVGTFYEVALRDGQLELRHARLGAFALLPLGEDRFAIEVPPLAGVRFARTGAAITGLELEAYSWSVTSAFRKVTLSP